MASWRLAGLPRALEPGRVAALLASCDRGIRGSGQMLMILLADAEVDGLICSGRVDDGEHTDALMDERAPTPRRPGRTEALAELALRYFTGHGPAAERDLAYWATLTLTGVRAGAAGV